MGYLGQCTPCGRVVKTLLKVMLLCLLLQAFVAVHWTVSALGADDEKVGFRWALGALVERDGESRLESVTHDASLRSGERFKMMIELQKPCFVYVIHHSAQGQIALLFPYSMTQFETDYRVGRKYSVPEGDAWFELDEHPGKETLYLLAAPERLKELEGLLSRYASAEASAGEELQKQILETIRGLRKQHRELAAPAERPVTIGGTVRELMVPEAPGRPKLDSIAVDIRSGGTLVRTFTIEHKE
ncbi:MAG: DUF4384 domain-containing protein [Syntrophobacteraceae bacterium]|nr:DUF4384 domain-containing protein [Syntrophobacteraceae bacterium]